MHAGDCPLGARCCAAHGLGELRVLAAIAHAILPSTYKTQRCRAFDTKDGCPAGARFLARQPAFLRAQKCTRRLLLDELVCLMGGTSCTRLAPRLACLRCDGAVDLRLMSLSGWLSQCARVGELGSAQHLATPSSGRAVVST